MKQLQVEVRTGLREKTRTESTQLSNREMPSRLFRWEVGEEML